MAEALRPALVFVGFMGAGKSRAAREAAAALGVAVHDADALIEAELGEPIEAFFDREGEAAFRAVEEQVCVGLLETADGGAVALGGGALGSERVRAALARHVVVLLDVDLETAWQRASGGARPLARDRAAFEALFDARAPIYDAAADAVLPCTGEGVVARALGALQAIPEGHRLLWATAASGDYPVWVGPLRARAVARHRSARGRQRRDGGRPPRRARPGADGLIEIAPGEEHKTLQTAERVWRALAARGVTRADHVVALGGGVVGDLGGLLRGHLPARDRGRAGADDARGAGRLRLRRQDRRRPARGQELRRRLSPADGRADRPRAARHAARGGARRGLRRGPQDRADRRRAAVGARRRRRAGRRRDDRRLRAHEAARRRRRRARRRRAPGPQPRPHGRPRDRDGDRATPATATARRSASGCSPRCGSPRQDALREQVRELLSAPAYRRAWRAPRPRRWSPRPRATRSAPARPCRSCWCRGRAA